MIPHICTIKHDPENGKFGDCLRASVASILDIENVNDVPHFYHDGCEPETGDERFRAWLLSRGLAPFVLFFDGVIPRDEIMQCMAVTNTDINYLLFGLNADGVDHVVICRNDKIIHDTAWFKTEIVKSQAHGMWSVMVFVPVVLTNV